MVHDLLPILLPDCFPPDDTALRHTRWLETVAQTADEIVCVSGAVASDVTQWISANISPDRCETMDIKVLHHGANIQDFCSRQITINKIAPLKELLKGRLNFLMVGTIEPRKGHLQALTAFDLLWRRGMDVHLIIVGKEGWTSLKNNQRRTIPEIVERLNYHPEKERHHSCNISSVL